MLEVVTEVVLVEVDRVVLVIELVTVVKEVESELVEVSNVVVGSIEVLVEFAGGSLIRLM